MGQVQRFTEARRAEWLGLLKEGKTQEEANATVGVSTRTVAKWLARGKDEAEGTAFDFVQAYEAIPRPRRRQRPSELVTAERAGGLSEEQLVGLLEAAAVDGNVQAQKYLLERPWERKRDDETESKQEASVFDELQAFRDRKGAA